ncbi:tRNA (adenosine(37)-N6)-threonylcarbamoyltransferase complex ATPase subunit type 1 TsaE [candidate division WOR-1 bacterium RIFOXYC2_FULL_37_10]|uniref:tRNA threonylcarbamoyladenosine biosynthesis protein TsaE n=1 Tax=candidate division WOR-1 bacterium RIFOXYB2_FULL_37_13 TaxID=1802579 RepID=A0A1F4SHD3_UNCSA|nr:MAG: tRNA (adenosine(37)-N6)-threonylcarbamoyltransferase complex ATPase subunit type 1 TsaE [candidate division WOR-1 bacterium RIFOXYA2_FULL_37_7]OGC19844.1 MAG: tRNA (adenosine(37)-N6)-threonylcarbamoyltransferase complex ATPase subunit type 1 TsaE [candidate division WOR-1 bacterium RIFOXYB2_FULL_37_13]OGC32937.1 MAG: tRNA (adenosine(37)-N6)-threonylcarbamoyltransferase complex ATPase subunit type 1 TsaE [candidate division WOR-1 bacterium RIFOXYC2_FULL_37_10]
MKITTERASETIELGKKIGASLKENDVVALFGELGSGKTTFSQGIAKGLLIKDYVISPTFILINEYKGRIPLYHIDLYRLEKIDDIKDLGIEEYFYKNGVCLIEWAERLGPLLPKNAKIIEFEIIEENKRMINIKEPVANL